MAAEVLEQHTVLPPAQSGVDSAALVDLLGVLRPTDPANRARLTGPDGSVVALPDEIYDILREVVDALARGQAISVAPVDAVLTTQQAADMLNISRPTLVKLLENGDIPFEKPGRHRRVRLADLLAYKQRAREQRRRLLSEMTAAASEQAEDDSQDRVIHTR